MRISDWSSDVVLFRSDAERGLRLLTLAARKGDSYAMELLGRVYLEGGKGIRPDAENAEVWLARAADRGDVSSMTLLGSAHLDKIVPDRDPQQGIDRKSTRLNSSH